MSRRRRAIALPDETAEALRARLRRFVRATRDEATGATGAVPIPFPEHVTVLAGPLRRIRGAREPRTVPVPAGRAGSDARREDGDQPGSAPGGFALDDTGRAGGTMTK
ncbi:hypothetical protein OKW30_006010 [Paraburkholderia sp. Clong3]|uniref:hypothetical protein n=1 Tax=Paraburkholderia sp. Clong3 TaxID=2991061 RepID=UPI003D19A285